MTKTYQYNLNNIFLFRRFYKIIVSIFIINYLLNMLLNFDKDHCSNLK